MSRIRIERDGGVTTLTLTRPEKRNALDTEMLDAIYAFCQEPPQPTDRVVVIRSEGHVFCAGIDLAERQRQGVTQTTGESPVVKVFHAIESHPLPFVCMVQGAAIAGGCELALHCDFVVASTRARFGMSLAQIGIAPTWALAQKLLEVAGPVMTREILLLGDPIPATKMVELGIIGRVVEPEELESETQKVVFGDVNRATEIRPFVKTLGWTLAGILALICLYGNPLPSDALAQRDVTVSVGLLPAPTSGGN